MPTVLIDRDAAHAAAERELSKPIYPRESLTQKFMDWLDEVIFKLILKGSEVPGGWFTVAVLLTLVGIAVFVAIRVARKTIRTGRGSDYELFGDKVFSAAEHRATAERFAAEGNWAAAIRHRLRAVARQLANTMALNPVPGRTASELAHDAGRSLPDLNSELTYAATSFNDVTYGERPGTEPAYRMIADLDDHLRSRGAASGVVAAAPVADTWTAVR